MMLAIKATELLEEGDQVTFCFDELATGSMDMYQKDRTGIWTFQGYHECPVKCDNVFCKGKMMFNREDGREFYKCMFYYLSGGLFCPIKSIYKMNFGLDEMLFEI